MGKKVVYPSSSYLEKYYHHDMHDSQEDADLLHLKCAGLLLKNPEYVASRKVLTHDIFEYVLDGEGFIKHDGTNYHVKKGDFIIIRKDTNIEKEFSYGSSKQKPYLKLWFAASGSFINGMFTAFNITKPVTIVNCTSLREFNSFVMSLPKKEYNQEAIMVQILSIMYSVFRKKHSPDANTESFDTLVDAFLEENIRRPASLEEATSILGVSKRNFMMYFKKRFNSTYSKYMQEQRLQFAAIMLGDKKHSISEIAIDLGFCDQSYFSNCFYKKFGMYPSEYRKQILKS